MAEVCSKVRPAELLPEMCAAAARASGRMEMEDFLRELENNPTFAGNGDVGLPRSTFSRRCLTRFTRVMDLLAPSCVAPSPSVLGKREEALDLSDDQKRAAPK